MAWLKNVFGDFVGLWLERPIGALLVCALGGALAFGYSYVPLHAAKQHRVERLESELASEAGRGLALAERLAELELQMRMTPGSDEVSNLQQERVAAEERASELESDLARAEKRTKQLERDRSRARKDAAKYKKQVAELTAERDSLRVAARSRTPAKPAPAKPRPAPSADQPAVAGARPPADLAIGDSEARAPASPAPRPKITPDQF